MAVKTPFEPLVQGEVDWRAVDWTADLLGEDIAATPDWMAVPNTLTTSQSSHQNKIARITISGGVVGKTYGLRCTITTSGNRTLVYERSITVVAK